MATVKAAEEDKLGALHNRLADVFIAGLEGEVVINEDGEEVVVPPSPQFLNAARAFLKDNEIICVASKNNRIGKMEDLLKKHRETAKKRFNEGLHVIPLDKAEEG